MSARDELNLALDLDESRLQIPCTDPTTGQDWTAEDHEQRARAVTGCTGCPVLILCATVADVERHRFGVWGGRDRGVKVR